MSPEQRRRVERVLTRIAEAHAPDEMLLVEHVVASLEAINLAEHEAALSAAPEDAAPAGGGLLAELAPLVDVVLVPIIKGVASGTASALVAVAAREALRRHRADLPAAKQDEIAETVERELE